MSEYVDERVVEMRFDNQNFEKNVQTSLKTLSELNKRLKLDDAGKSFDSLQKASSKFDLSNLANNVQTVADRFSFLGIVGDEVIRRLTNGFIDLGQAVMSTVKSLTIDQVGVGFDKYERKVQSVQTIMNATGKSIDEVSESLDKLNWFTDETSYSYSDMVDNISKFTNANVPLETAVTSMIGIADAAGLAGVSVQDASHAMEGFSKAIAQGYMSRQNWQWIRTAHMDTTQFKDVLIQAALAEGTLTKAADGTYKTIDDATVSIEDFETALKDGWMTTKVMNDALEQFGGTTESIYQEYLKTGDLTSDIIARMGTSMDDLGLKAFRSAQEAKTFSDAINAVKDAVSTGWMTSFEKIFGNYEEAKYFWTDVANDLWDVFASGGETRNDILDTVFGKDSLGKFKSELSKVGVSFEQFEKSLKSTAESSGLNFDDLISGYDSVSDALRDGAISSDLAKKALLGLTEGMSSTSTQSVDLNKKLEEVKKKVDDVILGVYGNGEARRQALTELGDSYEYIQGLVNKVLLEGREITLEDVKIFEQEIENITELTEEQKKALLDFVNGAEDAEVAFDDLMSTISKKSGQEMVHEMVLNILGAVKQLQEVGRSAFDNIFGDADKRAEVLYSLIERLHSFTENLTLSESATANLQKTLEGLLSIFKFFGITVSRVFYILSPFKDLFDLSSDSILEFTGNIGEAITGYVEWYEKSEDVIAVTDKLRGYVSRVVEVLRKLIGYGKRLVGKIIPPIRNGISDVIDTIRGSRLAKYLNSIKTAIKDVWKYIEKIDFDKIKIDTSKVSGFISGARESIIAFYNTIKNFLLPYVQKGISFFTNFRESIAPLVNRFNTLKDSIKASGGVFKFLGEKISEIKNKVTDFISDGGLGRLFEGFLEKLEPIKDEFHKFLDSIQKELDGIDWSRVLAFSLGFSLIPAILSISAAFGEAAKLFKTGKGLLGQISGILTKFKNGFKTTAMEIAEAAVAFSVAIAILAGSLWLLAEKTDPEKLKAATIQLGAIMGVFAATTIAIGFMSKSAKDMYKALTSMVAFAGAIAILVGALYVLQKVKFDWDLAGRIAIILGLMGAMFAAALGLSKLGVKMEGVGLYFLTFAGAILVLAMAMERIADIPIKKLDQSMEAIAILMVGLGGLTALSKIGKGSGFGLLGLVGAAYLIVRLLKLLGDEEVSTLVETAKKNWGLFAALLGAMIVTSIIGRIAGKESAGLGVAIALISASLLIVYEALKLFGALDADTLKKGGLIVGVIMLLFAVLAKASSKNFGKAEKLGVAIAVMSASLLLVYWAVKSFASMDVKSLGKGLAAITVIFALYAGLLAVTALSGKGKTGPIVAMAATLVVVAASLVILSSYSWSQLIPAVASLVIVIGAIGVAFALMGKIKADKSTIIVFAEAIAMLAAISASLYFLADKDWAGMLAAAGSISAVLLAISAAIKIISGTEINNASAGAFAISLIGVVIIGMIIGHLASLPWDGMLAAAGSISAVLLAVAGAIKLMNGVKLAGAVEGSLGLIAAILVLAAGLAAIGWLFDFLDEKFGVGGKLDKGVAVAAKIGEAIGGLVGGIFAGISKAMFDVLPDIGQDLADFMESAQPFFDGLKDVPSNIGLTMASIAGGLTALMAENALSSIFSLFTGYKTGISGFSDQMEELAVGLSKFAENAPTQDLSGSVGSIKGIIEALNAMPRSGGLWQLLAGNKDIKKFGENLTAFGEALSKYSSSISGMNADAITSSISAVDSVIAIANKIPTTGGLIGVFTGKTDWNGINNNLVTFGLAIRNYGGMVEGIKIEAIAASVPAAEYIDQIAEHIPGLFQNVNMAIVTQQLTSYGEAVKTFSETVAQINYPAIEQFSNLKEIGANIGSTLVAGLESKNLDVEAAVIRLINYAKERGSEKASDMNIVGADIVVNIANGISAGKALPQDAIKETFNAASQEARNQTDNMMSTIVGIIRNNQSSIRSELNILVAQFSQAFSGNQTAFMSSVAAFISNGITRIRSYYAQYSSAGSYLASGLSNGFRNVAINSYINSVMSSSVSTVRGYYMNFYNAGYYIITGLTNGIRDYTYLANRAVANMAINMNRTFNTYNQIRSPSRLYEKSAQYIPLGTARGINDNADVAADAVEDMGYQMITAISPALVMLSDIMNSEFDFSPSIRPVVDMSDVYNHSKEIGSLFNGNNEVSVMAGDISKRISSIEGRKFNSDEVNGSDGPNQNVVINNYVYTQPGQNTEEIADAVEDRLTRKLIQKKVAFVR